MEHWRGANVYFSRGTISLQKQIGCFNHRGVTMVTDKLERPWLLEGMED